MEEMTEQMNLFSEHFDMKYILEKVETDFTKNKDLLYNASYHLLNSETSSKERNVYENEMKEKQKKIITQARLNYKKLNNINYVKYYLPYNIQPETNNTKLSETKKHYKTNFKQSILKELQLKKQAAEHKINNFIKRYTGQFKRHSLLHTQVSKLYKMERQIEIFMKNRKYQNKGTREKNGKIAKSEKIEKNHFIKVIGNIVFFDKQINMLVQNAIIKNNIVERKVPWIFIQ